MERVIRNFALGSEWLFYKIYVGPKTGDALLTQAVKPLVYKLVSDSLVEKWFFIRYTDPNFHIRLRLRLMHNPAKADRRSVSKRTLFFKFFC
tara:strand:- start:1972 stop:2247 length:276 start_codon:yes stop_codon:yes gene_type:complete